jgi:ankyrin repeat protein
MTSQLVLLKAIRSGQLEQVRAALGAGVRLDDADEQGEPGLPMGIACFLGHVEIVRELAGHGAKVDLPDNQAPTSPLSMAVRGGRVEVVRTLIELGAKVPEGMATGLSEHDIMLAKWKAFRDGHGEDAQAQAAPLPDIEEIVMVGCSNTDTQVLEAEVLRQAAQKMR